jgi:hypothetical protein
MMNKRPESIPKAELLAIWHGLKPKADLSRIIRPLPYKHSGSTYGNDGIRIDGSKEFIFEVLSRVKDLLACEHIETRLQLSFSEIASRTQKSDGGVEFGAGTGEYCCYIRAAQRGCEGSMAAAYQYGGLKAAQGQLIKNYAEAGIDLIGDIK